MQEAREQSGRASNQGNQIHAMEELKEFRSTTWSDTQEKKYINKERVLSPRPDNVVIRDVKNIRIRGYSRIKPATDRNWIL